MTTMSRSLTILLAGVACCLPLLAGCGKSAPAQFYSLSTAAPQAATPPDGPCRAIGIGPVDFPAYLDRSQIITRTGENQMHLAEFHQWIESPRDGFQRALADNLPRLVCAKPLFTYPWPVGGHPDRQIVIQVARFDGTLGQEAVLRISWSVLDNDNNTLDWRSVEYREPAQGPDYAALAAAQSRLVEQFAKDVAASLGAGGNRK
ncbi:PqiC family protein [Solidesulfovibrio sp.]